MILTKLAKIQYENRIRELIFSREGRLDLGWGYDNAGVKIGVTCPKGHRWKSLWGHLKNGHWCPFCDGQVVTEEEVRAFIEIKKGTIVDKNWAYFNKKAKIPIVCEKGHPWNTSWESLNSGRDCPYCVGHTVGVAEAKASIINKGGILKPNWKYIDSTTKFWVECKECRHKWETCSNVIQSGHWCPHCRFKKEREFRELIEHKFKADFPRRRPQWLKSPFATRSLELDGYNEELKIAFEYQGEQHYELGHFNKTERELEITQRKDAFKIETCNKMGIKLIGIMHLAKLPQSNDL